jgi:uncharacterized membrane protein
MTFHALEAWWWPYLFILLAGWLATDATALVAAVIASLILTPNGALADAPIWLRLGAAGAGFAVYLAARKHMLAGILVAEAVLVGGMMLG